MKLWLAPWLMNIKRMSFPPPSCSAANEGNSKSVLCDAFDEGGGEMKNGSYTLLPHITLESMSNESLLWRAWYSQEYGGLVKQILFQSRAASVSVSTSMSHILNPILCWGRRGCGWGWRGIRASLGRRTESCLRKWQNKPLPRVFACSLAGLSLSLRGDECFFSHSDPGMSCIACGGLLQTSTVWNVSSLDYILSVCRTEQHLNLTVIRTGKYSPSSFISWYISRQQ